MTQANPEVPAPGEPGHGGPEVPGSAASTSALVAALEVLRTRLGGLRLPLDVAGAEAARRELGLATDQLDDYLLPRLRAESAPLLVVVGGSTGAGKSTLVNSLLGEQVSAPGVLRPTTRDPVLVHNPADARWFTTGRVLPGLARNTTDRGSVVVGSPDEASGLRGAGAPAPTPGTAPGHITPPVPEAVIAHPAPAPKAPPTGSGRALRLVASAHLPPGLALVDAPDIDSVETANRDLAAQLLGAADLWVFVTTAARYADAVPWDLLRRAAERRAQVALVLDRVDPGAEAVAGDLRRMLVENGLGDAPLFVIGESGLTEGFLPEEAIGELSSWLSALGADAGERTRVALATRDGVIDDLVARAGQLAAASEAQAAADGYLRTAVTEAYAHALDRVDAATSDGAILRGEVLARWQDFVGTSEFFRAVDSGVAKVRDAVGRFFRGRPTAAPHVEQAIAHGLESVLLDAAEDAAERAYAAWRADPAARVLLDGLELSRASAGIRAEIGAQIRGWQADVLELVREQGASRRGTARALSFGVNGLGLSLMVVVFASTGGLTGAEVGIAGGTAIVAQKLLESVFGDDAVRRLTTTARERLLERSSGVLTAEADRFLARLDMLETRGAAGAADALRAASREVEIAADSERSSRASAPPRERLAVGRLLRGAHGAGRGSRQLGAASPDEDPRISGTPSGPTPAKGGPKPWWRRVFGGAG